MLLYLKAHTETPKGGVSVVPQRLCAAASSPSSTSGSPPHVYMQLTKIFDFTVNIIGDKIFKMAVT